MNSHSFPEPCELTLSSLFPRIHAWVFLSLFIPLLAFSQQPEVPAPETSSEQESEDVYDLNPFVVDATSDDGYLATNATSGTRLNVAIKDLPMSVEVITSDFIQDTGASDLQESLAYSSGVSLEGFLQGGIGSSDGPGANTTSVDGAEVSPSASGSLGDKTTNAISIRGFTAPFQQRMGFRVGATIPRWGITLGSTIDSVSIERNEILRGPGALLYGIGVISGIVNVIPKRPLPEEEATISFGAGDNEYRRATLDATGPLLRGKAGTLSYRVATAFTERGDWTDFYLDTRQYYTGQLQYDMGNKLSLLLEIQKSKTKIEGIGQQYLYDSLDASVNNDEFRNKWNEQFNWGLDFGDLDRAHRITGPDTEYERDETTWLANLQFTPIQNLTFNIGAFVAEQEVNEFTVQARLFSNRWGPVNVKADLDPEMYFVLENPPSSNPIEDTNDYKTVGYWWVNRPQDATSQQYRAEATYEFEGPGILGNSSRHSLLAGFHYIQDDVDFWRGTERIGNVHQEGNTDNDGFYVRNFNDISPFTYEGETLARPGNFYSSSTLWYRGYYGVYHGRFLDERLTLIGGYRTDSFQGYQEDWERNPYDATNEKLGTSSSFHYFDESETVSSATFSIGYSVTDNLSVYGLVAEGVSPNVGQTDGNFTPFPSERTKSEEVGIKFDTANRWISGTVSVYRITRENALWNWSNAPNPRVWADTPFDEFRDGNTDQRFDPSAVDNGEVPISYGVDWSYFSPEDFGGWDPTNPRERRTIEQVAEQLGLVGLAGSFDVGATEPGFSGTRTTLIFLEYDKLDEGGWRDEIEAAWAESRNRSQPDDINPIDYRTLPTAGLGNNPSNNFSRGSVVSFTDEAVGMDFQIFLRPTEFWQIVLSYAHTEREAVSGFNMVDAVGLTTGNNYGTEYDIWVRDLGRENFEDPTRPSSATGGGVEGLSLSFVPEDSASIWSNYKIREGFLNGFDVGVGVIYQGPAQTSVAIGGSDLASNFYRTPDTKDLVRINATITYQHRFEKFDLRVSLNGYNLFETDPYHESTVSYDNPDTGGQEFRRSFYYTQPRYFRLTATVSF